MHQKCASSKLSNSSPCKYIFLLFTISWNGKNPTWKLWTFVKQEFLYERFVIQMSEKMRKVLVSLPIDQKHSPPFGSKFVKQIFSYLTDSFFSLIIFALVSPSSIIIMVDTYDGGIITFGACWRCLGSLCSPSRMNFLSFTEDRGEMKIASNITEWWKANSYILGNFVSSLWGGRGNIFLIDMWGDALLPLEAWGSIESLLYLAPAATHFQVPSKNSSSIQY